MSIMQKTRGLALAIAGSLALTVLGAAPALAQSPEADPNVIQMTGSRFVPDTMTVVVGTTLTWVNLDGEDHDVLANDKDLSFGSPTIGSGATWEWPFNVPGTYPYVCSFHAPDMTGVIYVTDVPQA